jgi:hypothetical protein
MKGLITVLAVVVVLGLAFFLYRTPTAPPEMTEAEVAAVEEAVLAQANALIETQNAFDADGFLAQFSTEDLDWINQSTHFASYGAVAETIRNFFVGLDAFDSGWKDVSVEIISRKAALCRGEWWGEQTRGDVVSRYESVFWTALHELQADGTWKITRVHQSWPDPVTRN